MKLSQNGNPIHNGQITHVEPTGTWSNGTRTMNKFRVSFSNGHKLGFLATRNFIPQVGERIYYEMDTSRNTGRWLKDYQDGEQGTVQRTSNPQKTKADNQTMIVRQSSLKTAVEFLQDNPHKTVEQVIEIAKQFENHVLYNG